MAHIFETVSLSTVCIHVVYHKQIGIEGEIYKGYASGFLAHEGLGLIVTNKHVITEGPVTMTALIPAFSVTEEIQLDPCYIDPIHDFGFLKINHSSLEKLKDLNIKQLTLTENADIQVGQNIVAVGALNRYKLGFELGKIIDTRAFPVNGMDFDISMFTATDNTGTGFSGGPVLNAQGQVIGVVASNITATKRSYHLPIIYVTRSLKSFILGKTVSRMTLGFTCRDVSRDTNVTGLQVVSVYSDISEDIKPREIVTKLAGIPVDNLVTYADIVDNLEESEPVPVTLQSGQDIRTIQLKPRNLENTKLNEFLEISLAILHRIELNVCLYYGLEQTDGIFLAENGFMFQNLPSKIIIKQIDDVKIKSLNDIIVALNSCYVGDCILVSYCRLGSPLHIERTTVYVENDRRDRHWEKVFDAEKCRLVYKSSAINYKPRCARQVNSNTLTRDYAKGYAQWLVDVIPLHMFPNEKSSTVYGKTTGIMLRFHKDELFIVCSKLYVSSLYMRVQVIISRLGAVGGEVCFVSPTNIFAIIKVNLGGVSARLIPNMPFIVDKLKDFDNTDPNSRNCIQVLSIKTSEGRTYVENKLHSFSSELIYMPDENLNFECSEFNASMESGAGFLGSDLGISGFYLNMLREDKFVLIPTAPVSLVLENIRKGHKWNQIPALFGVIDRYLLSPSEKKIFRTQQKFLRVKKCLPNSNLRLGDIADYNKMHDINKLVNRRDEYSKNNNKLEIIRDGKLISIDIEPLQIPNSAKYERVFDLVFCPPNNLTAVFSNPVCKRVGNRSPISSDTLIKDEVAIFSINSITMATYEHFEKFWEKEGAKKTELIIVGVHRTERVEFTIHRNFEY